MNKQWSWDYVNGNAFDYGDDSVSPMDVEDLLNKSGTRPDDPDELLEARARLTEERLERGLDLINRAVQVWGDDDTFGNDLAGWISELLLGEGE